MYPATRMPPAPKTGGSKPRTFAPPRTCPSSCSLRSPERSLGAGLASSRDRGRGVEPPLAGALPPFPHPLLQPQRGAASWFADRVRPLNPKSNTLPDMTPGFCTGH